MIRPTNRMLVWLAVASLPLALAYAFAPDAVLPLGLVGGVYAVLAALDAFRAPSRLDGIAASLPEIARLTKDREGVVDVTIEWGGPVGREKRDESISTTESPSLPPPGKVRLALSFPPQFKSEHEDTVATLPKDARRAVLHWPVTPTERGVFELKNVYMETPSPMGLWATRKVCSARAELRVYPNTLRERKSLAAAFLNRGMLGVHARNMVGKGREFEKLREYAPGDSYEDIHWKATAKRGQPVTRLFQIERTQELYVVIDSSRLSARKVKLSASGFKADEETIVASQLERFITAAMALGLVAEKQGDLFGVLAFGTRVRSFVRARNGKAHYGVCRDALFALKPEMANPDFSELFSFIRMRMRRRALLVFLTNLDDPALAESFVHDLDIISRQHLVLVNMLSAPGVAPLFSGPDVNEVDDLYKRLGGHIQWRELKELEKLLKRRGVSMALLDNEMLSPQLVSQYLDVKRRQLI